MPKSKTVVFNRTLLAIAVVSLSACSSMPRMSDFDLGKVGDGIVYAGKATANAGRKTWNTTTYLLGFTDTIGDSQGEPSDEQLLMIDSDVNQVLPLSEPPIITAGTSNRPMVVQRGTASNGKLRKQQLPDLAATAPAMRPALESVAKDLVHVVQADETLWNITKSTTGDANNWHILADINNLEQSAAVYPGQQLLIPAEMVKPGYNADALTIQTARVIDAKNIGGSSTAADNAGLNESPLLAPRNDVAQETTTVSEPLNDAAALRASVEQDATAFNLNDGETLWDFSKRTTGDATNWQAIANHNQFSDKQAVTVRPGQTIYVPQSLVRDSLQTSTSTTGSEPLLREEPLLSEEPLVEKTVVTIASSEPVEPEVAEQRIAATIPVVTASAQRLVTDTSSELAAATAALDDDSNSIEIVEATYKTDDSPTPLNTEAAPVAKNDNIPANIMVSGTYYPKAVYNNADFSSSLLMRVSPGTQLQVSRAMGTWYEVETEKGVGYVHQRDIK